MRFLAATFALLAGPSLSMGIGEFEKQIAAEPTIVGKITIAEKAFDTIEGFVPRELFMSYWSIDALSEISSAYREVLGTEGIESLVDEYSNISRICSMEMGDYRYFFEPLKTDIESLLERNTPSEGESEISDGDSIWSEDSIKSLIEFWLVSGQTKWRNEIEMLLKSEWSDADVEYWNHIVSDYRFNPTELLAVLEIEFLENQGPTAIAQFLQISSGNDRSIWSIPTISTNQSEVSSGGPRLD